MDGNNSRPSPEGPKILDGYITEDELARQRRVNIRTCQRDRALRRGPPYVVLGRQVYYRVEAVRTWLQDQEQPRPGRRKVLP